MKQSTNTFLSLLPLYLLILLDVMGVILVLPVLTPLILQTDSGIVPAGTPLLVRDFLYGFSLALFPLFMFFSTPVLGDLSDKFGRKKILLICLVASAIAYGVSAIGVLYKSLLIFLISRGLAGLAAGTQPIATAAIIDLSTSETKTKNLAWVVFTSSLGLILGPLAGGLTAEKNLVSWFSYDTPFILAAILCLLNAVFLYFSLQEKSGVKSENKVSITKGFVLFMQAFLERKFRLLSLLFFSFELSWSLYYQAINWFFLEKYHYTTSQLGFFVGFMGVVFAFTSSVALRIIMKFFSRETVVYLFCILVMAISFFGSAMSNGELAQWLWAALISSSNVICFTYSLSLFSHLVDTEAQGWIMGVTGAIGAITWAIGGFITGPLGYLSIHAPLWTGGLLCLISFTLMLIYHHTHYKTSHT